MHFRSEITLTDGEYALLIGRLAEFKAADNTARSTIVEECAEEIKTGWQQDVEFDREKVKAVCALSI